MTKHQIKTMFYALAVSAPFLYAATYTGLCVRRYACTSAKVEKPVKLALIADLHGCRYGKSQLELLTKIHEENPDALVMSGDIFDDKLPFFGTMEFLDGITGKYPCFFAAGNHEYRTGTENRLKDILRRRGVRPLSGDSTELTAKNGQRITICGVDDPEGGIKRFERQLRSAFVQHNADSYTVLLTHRPELLKKYARYPCDLVLAGHAHGGQWRIPRILNGLFAPSEGFFPKYAGGEYVLNGTRMIVSRGLAKESTPIVPRIFNRPELVIIDVLPKKSVTERKEFN